LRFWSVLTARSLISRIAGAAPVASQLHAGEQAGHQRVVGVGEGGAHAHAAGARVELVVDEFQLAFVREARFRWPGRS
jgi:hypothetical protein